MTEPDYKQICGELQEHCFRLRCALHAAVEGEITEETRAVLAIKPPFYPDLPVSRIQEAQAEIFRELNREHAKDLVEFMAKHGYGKGIVPALHHEDAPAEGDQLSFDGVMVFMMTDFVKFLKASNG